MAHERTLHHIKIRKAEQVLDVLQRQVVNFDDATSFALNNRLIDAIGGNGDFTEQELIEHPTFICPCGAKMARPIGRINAANSQVTFMCKAVLMGTAVDVDDLGFPVEHASAMNRNNQP